MSFTKNKTQFLILSDFAFINLAWILFYLIRVESKLIQTVTKPEIILPSLLIYLYWLSIFFIAGLYRKAMIVSRLDEITKVIKTTFFGMMVLFLVIFFDDTFNSSGSGQRYIILLYWVILFVSVSLGRTIVHTYQRSLLSKGYGKINTLIIGYDDKSRDIFSQIDNLKALALSVKGFISLVKNDIGDEYKGVKVIDSVENIPSVIQELKIDEVIISLDKKHHEELLSLITLCDVNNVKIKIVPDLYEIISGQARTNQVYGIPLIEVMPQLMSEWEMKMKRGLDVFVSFLLLLFSFPIMIITAIMIKLDSKGPVIFKQMRTGKDEKVFKMYKFRSMVSNAEKLTGEVWATKNDPRITKVGKVIRKYRIDELPQLINVLKGEMSLVGPRPELPSLVEKLSQQVPFFKRRLKVRPGITGWAQVKHKYDETIEDVKKKLEYDLFYIENASMKLDLSILFRTVFVVLFGKGHFEK